VQIDGKTDGLVAEFNTYFPKELRVRPGDAVEFTSVFTGAPHTVTLGTLVNAGIPEALAAGPMAAEEPVELAKISSLLPEGPGNAIQATAQPCYLPSGDPPQSEACSADQQQPRSFTGTETYVNSGFLPDGEKFRLQLADTIAPGDYYYFCTLHRAVMNGKITVVDRATPVPGPTDVAAQGRRAFDDLATRMQPTAEAVRAGTMPPFVTEAAPGQVIAGSLDPNMPEVLLNEFGPKDVMVPAGGSLTWLIFGPHTVSFAFPEQARTVLSKTPDGTVNLNPDSVTPVDSPGAPPPPEGAPPAPDRPPGPPTIVDGGAWDGEGFKSSGFFLSVPPQMLGYKMTFTQPGTYPYACLIHPDMKGSVTVR
jgi:plastocyanin